MTTQQTILEANLAQLRRTEPELADRVAHAEPAALQWADSKSGPVTATMTVGDRPIALASRYDPAGEARALIDNVDLTKHAGVVLLGMGLGHHVMLLAEQVEASALMIVFEPDTALLRAVLEKIDHSSWLGQPNVIIADDQMDRSAMLARIEPYAALLTSGTILLTHPPSRQRCGEALQTFGAMVTDVLAFCRTNVATSLVNASRTISNLSMNLAHYAAGPLTDELFNLARGCPAVCVGAGPSLAKNVDLLADPQVRQNVIVITAQTTLRPLIERGIMPDFVTALDYSTVSKRFYEGLPDLPDVTMIAEPLAHPAILECFPGPKRVTYNRFLDRLLGDLARPMVPIAPGATVAHLSFYVAQHLGCDPIILIGQDLGFSDGLYYCPGTAIDDVWAPELGAFNTLEMMQWQRIVRHRGQLQKVDDVHGRAIYTDEQMRTYLQQFERDFARAPQTVLDATEGGVPKQHTTQATLAEALDQYATSLAPTIPLPTSDFDETRLVAVIKLLQSRIDEVAELRRVSRKTIPLLKKMQKHQRDRQRMEKLFDDLNPLRRRVDELGEAFALINELNTVGAFRRARADRAIQHSELDPVQEQTQRLERDLDNVDWLIQACDEANEIFRNALDRIRSVVQSSRRSVIQSSSPSVDQSFSRALA